MKKTEYGEWVRKVRGKISREEFGKQIVHFSKDEQGKTICETYHRNEIRNWEIGESIPKIKNIETFLSISLFEYDRMQERRPINCAERNQRYEYARKAAYNMLGVDLYCRSLHDALLIQVCRGVLSFSEVPEYEDALSPAIQSIGSQISAAEKNEAALERATSRIESDWYKITDKQMIPELVKKSSIFFYTWDRTLGVNINRLYESRERYVISLPLQTAVCIYAPNYQITYMQKFLHSSGTSRQWLLDLCIHLRFNRDEIQQVLEYAHMAPLSEEKDDFEYYLRENGKDVIGSAGWYRFYEQAASLREIQYEGEFFLHFGAARKWPLEEKLSVLLLIVCCIEEDNIKELPPIDYLMESFTHYRSKKRKGRGDEVLGKLSRILRNVKCDDWECEELQRKLRRSVSEWMDYVRTGYDTAEACSAGAAFKHYQQEFREYMEIPDQYIRNVRNKDAVKKLRYIAGLIYTVFTGQYYTGSISSADFEIVKEAFAGEDEDTVYTYNFISYVIGIFLAQNEIYEDKSGAFYIYDSLMHNRKSMLIDQREITENLWDSIIALHCTK